MSKHLEYIIKSRVPSLQSLINQIMIELEIELSPHRNHIITAPGIKSKTLTLRFYSEYVVSNSMTRVWDPGWQGCMYFSIFLSDFALVVATSSIFNLFDNYLEKNKQNKKRKKMELFVFSYQCMIFAMDICLCRLKDFYMHSIPTGGSVLAYIRPIFGGGRVDSNVPNSNLEDKVLFEEGSIVVNKANTIRTFGPNLLNKTDPVRTIGPGPKLRESPRIKHPNRLLGSYICDPGGCARQAFIVE
uniref:Uncharacterized protein isoform X1 n=1 Tax=Nicotiana tabacum TaxID=4097 RepID=A0A1S3Y2N5_TOBAC|nr:PREDICTED: uncharacterized protein LOC107771523 isoform X1 [Nicotiana tabacum]